MLPGRVVAGSYGFKRLDVLASVRGKPQAEYSGWKLELELAPVDTALDLEAADEAGAWLRFFLTELKVGEGFGPLDFTSYEQWLEVYDRPTAEALPRAGRPGRRLRPPAGDLGPPADLQHP